MNLAKLTEPFAANEIEWRVGQSGQNKKGIWCKVLAYVTNRAIMNRLDEICRPENWRNEYRDGADKAILCGISIRVTRNDGTTPEWITKWDGAEQTDIEAVKGGLSNAMKRAAVQWGIGRYLYDLEEGWAVVSEDGENYVGKNDKKEMPAFRWSPPNLPKWALPNAEPEPKAEVKGTSSVTTETGPVTVPANRLVRGKKLGDYTGGELNEMNKKLRAEGKDTHKYILADIVKVLNDRTLGPKPTPIDPNDDDARVAGMRAGAEADDAGLLALGMKP